MFLNHALTFIHGCERNLHEDKIHLLRLNFFVLRMVIKTLRNLSKRLIICCEERDTHINNIKLKNSRTEYNLILYLTHLQINFMI